MNFGKTLIIQPSPGIGDMLWHLPYLRALARQASHGKISLLTKPRNLTKEWLAHDPIIDRIHYFDRQGLTKSISLIRQERFDTVWILHRSFSYALMAFLGGIKNRYGFGYGKQKALLTKYPVLDLSFKNRPTIDQVRHLLDLHHIPYDPTQYDVFLPPDYQNAVRKRFSFLNASSGAIALGIGGSEEFKMWPLDSFVKLALSLQKQGFPHIFLCGGPQDAANAHYISEHVKKEGGNALEVTDASIGFSITLMRECNYYIGNDSALLNAAVCQGTPALGLFGATPPLTYSPLIHAIQGEGMMSISVESVVGAFQSLVDKNTPKSHVHER